MALAASSEEELLKLERRAYQRGVRFCSIREPDAPFHGALMAIGFLPGPKSAYKSLLGRYSLIKDRKDPPINHGDIVKKEGTDA